MVQIVKDASAGTLESSDVLVHITPIPERELRLSIDSVVMPQFGGEIERVVRETLGRMGVLQGAVTVNDKGALECILRARVETAVMRAAEMEQPQWRLME